MGWSGGGIIEEPVARAIDKIAASMLVRPANFFDIPALVDLGRQMPAESTYAFLAFDPVKLETMFRRYLSMPATCCVFVVEDNGVLIGGLCGYVTEYYFSTGKLTSDLALFVRFDRRGLGATKRLVTAFLIWAEERGAKESNLGISSGVQVERTGKLFEHFGPKHLGGNDKTRLV